MYVYINFFCLRYTNNDHALVCLYTMYELGVGYTTHEKYGYPRHMDRAGTPERPI